MRPHTLLQMVMGGTEVEIHGLRAPESALGLRKILVGAHRVGVAQHVLWHRGAHHIETSEGRLGRGQPVEADAQTLLKRLACGATADWGFQPGIYNAR